MANKILLDYDPLRGVSCFLETARDGDREKLLMTHVQDVTPILEIAKTMANDEDYTKRGIKDDQWHYARIPDVILLEMKNKHGADWYDKNDTNHRKFFRVLNEHYSKFKTTAWNHA